MGGCHVRKKEKAGCKIHSSIYANYIYFPCYINDIYNYCYLCIIVSYPLFLEGNY